MTPPDKKIKVIDAFTYFDEWDLLLARLDYLKGVVDGVVISQLHCDHQGKPYDWMGVRGKTIFDLCQRYPGLLIYLVNHDVAEQSYDYLSLSDQHKRPGLHDYRFVGQKPPPPYDGATWPYMWAQRNALALGVRQLLKSPEAKDWGFVDDNVLVLLSDVDEFPRAEVVDALREAIEAGEAPLGGVYRFWQRMFYYNCRTVSPNLWPGTVAVGLDPFCRLSPQWARYAPAVDIAPANGLEAGWHFSYFGGPEKVLAKMGRLCEGWTAQFADAGHVEAAIQSGGDLYNRANEKWVRLEQPYIDLPRLADGSSVMWPFHHSGIDSEYNAAYGVRFDVKTSHPVATESVDHQHPCGAARDNSRNVAFVYKVMGLFDENPTVLDIGCAGGGMVADFIRAGCPAVGIEGSDYPQKSGVGEWPKFGGKFLFTADASRLFSIAVTEQDKETVAQFDVVTSWEVLEHIRECDLRLFFLNVRNRLKKSGLFICSINSHPHEVDGVQYHATIMSPEWWSDRIEQEGFCRDRETEAYFGEDTVRRGHGNFVFRLKGDTQ